MQATRRTSLRKRSDEFQMTLPLLRRDVMAGMVLIRVSTHPTNGSLCSDNLPPSPWKHQYFEYAVAQIPDNYGS